jgi:predicted secreted hydrolase
MNPLFPERGNRWLTVPPAIALQRRPRTLRLLVALLLGALSSHSLFTTLRAQIPLTTAEGFAVPQPGHRFSFPRDHGNHPDFKIEWWYVTGHLYADATPTSPARRFGYQATFFRQAAPLTPAASAPPSPSFGDAHLYLAHMALLDVQTGRFLHQERLNREGWDATSSATTLDVRNGDWSLRLADPADPSPSPPLLLRGGLRADATFALTLTPAKPLVIFGEAGVSRKGADPSAASHYLTFTRLRTSGELTLRTDAGTEKIRVTGDSWMDHEISSSQLSAGQVGWDWLSIHFTDGRELMLYRLRLRDGVGLVFVEPHHAHRVVPTPMLVLACVFCAPVKSCGIS